MNNYVKFAKQSLLSKSPVSNITVVLGNESCDLDSAVSSLVYSYFLHWGFEHSSQIDHLHMPFLNIMKRDLPVKTEVIYLMKKYNIDLDNLLCFGDMNFPSVISMAEHFKLILVDHHTMEKKYSFLVPYVTQIFDHRPKDQSVWNYEENIKITISNVGSCSTLISAEILGNENGEKFLTENFDAASFLYETIILDTVNLLPSAGKAKPLDIDMVEKLENILNIEDISSHRKNIFDDLSAARADYSSLTTLQLLNRDLKIVDGLPVPGLPLRVIDFLNRDDVFDSIKIFCEHHKCKIIVIIGLVVVNNEVKRDMAIFGVGNFGLYNKIIKSLQEATDPSLELEQLLCPMDNCVYFNQKNIQASRKHIMPILKRTLQK